MDIEVLSLPLGRPFSIARGTRTEVVVVRVCIEQNGYIGLGECTPTARYSETSETVIAQIESLRTAIENGLSRVDLQALLAPGSARNVLDCALWRLEAALNKQSLWQCAQLEKPNTITIAETLSLDSLELMALAAEKAVQRGVELIKIKLDKQQVLEKVAAIRSVAPNATLIIDANEGWESLDIATLLDQLCAYHIAMVEQPLPAGKDHCLADFSHSIPVCADESCHGIADIALLKNRYEFINIKLDKCGGLSHALLMAEEAEKQGLRLMVGCMLGSSLAMESALPIATKAEFVDLDGPIWLAADNSPYLTYDHGKIIL